MATENPTWGYPAQPRTSDDVADIPARALAGASGGRFLHHRSVDPPRAPDVLHGVRHRTAFAPRARAGFDTTPGRGVRRASVPRVSGRRRCPVRGPSPDLRSGPEVEWRDGGGAPRGRRSGGSHTFTVTATDPNGNATTRQYQVTNPSVTKTFSYDADGNVTNDGTRTFEWNVRKQLVAVNSGTHRSEFFYDGLQRRVRVVEKESGTIQAENNIVWCEDEICEERGSDGTTVVRRAFGNGEEIGGANHCFTDDHLGSVTEVTDSSATMLARYAFDPFGRRSVVAGTDSTTVGFTRHVVDAVQGVRF